MPSQVDILLHRPIFGQVFGAASDLPGPIERYGQVSFADFYAKWVRKILPASFFVLVVSLLLAAVFYPPLLTGRCGEGE